MNRRQFLEAAAGAAVWSITGTQVLDASSDQSQKIETPARSETTRPFPPQAFVWWNYREYYEIPILIPESCRTPGVEFAAQRLAKALGRPFRKTEVQFKAHHRSFVTSIDLTGDAFSMEDSMYHVEATYIYAGSKTGLMYGLLALAERIEQNKSVPRYLSQRPRLQVRMTMAGFPFYLGCTQYGNFWKGNEAVEHRSDSPWFDRGAWLRTFQDCAERRINGLLFFHPHPYPALIRFEKFSEAAYFSAEETDQLVTQFQWMVQTGVDYGVRLYLLTQNIWATPGFQKEHAIAESGVDNELTRAYMRYCVSTLARTYPELGGLITMAAESPPGCVDFVLNSIVPGLNEAGARVPLIWWDWCSYPEDAKRVASAYRGKTVFMEYLQYEQFFKPMADPRILRVSKALGNAPMWALGGPKSEHGYLFWGDPEWVQKTVADLVRKHGVGLCFETYHEITWLSQKAFAYYAATSERYDREIWVKEVHERYGNWCAPSKLLDAMQTASRILPRFVCLVHSQTDHYMPQMGLPLVYYLEMPSLSTYVFEWYDRVDERGYLVPNYGLTFPNPDWGERVLTIKQFVAGEHEGTTPMQVADELERLASRTLSLAERVNAQGRAARQNDEEFRRLLSLLRLNGCLGRHYAHKIRAAVAWEQWKRGQGRARLVMLELQLSIDWWEKVSAAASEAHPQPVQVWRNQISKQPPWKQNDLWYSYASVRTHWREVLPAFHRELELVTAAMQGDRKTAVLPLWHELKRE